MRSTRVPLLVALVVLSLCAVPLSAGGVAPTAPGDDPSTASVAAADPAVAPADLLPSIQERDDDPSTTDTIGYVEGYWYDDELPVDERDDAVVEGDELDAVVYRSMARVEVVRDLTFEEEVTVDVISRAEFQAEQDDVFGNVGPTERIQENVNYEALFMVDRETRAIDAAETLYGGAVAGYYEPGADRVVLVSDGDDGAAVDEVILGHELLHALQDQHFDLTSYDRETIDQDNAKNGLIEGDAVTVEREYEQRCATEWACLEPPAGEPELPADVNWGLYFTIFQPYSDGPDYVDYLYEQGGWDAVDEAYDDPPASSSEVIHPGEERDPVAIDVEDRSGDAWEQLEIDGEPATETVGEAGMVSMFADGAAPLDSGQSVIETDEFVDPGTGGEELHYDQPYTDGWAGDELVTYVATDLDETVEPTDAAADAGYVWETRWESSEDAMQFVTGYLELLDVHGADPVADRQDTYVIDDDFPGAYFLEVDDDAVTIVNAPSVDALDEIEPGAAPEGDDELEPGDVTLDDDGAADGDETTAESDEIPGFGVPIAALALLFGVLSLRSRR